MHVVITGGAGFIGKKLASALLARGALETASGRRTIERLTLFDVVEAEGLPEDGRLTSIAGDITDLADVHRAIRDEVGGVFHLAAIVSANAEEDFDLGMRVNLDGTRNVLQACRALPQPARLVFASSVAVYGGAMPEVLDDGTILTPQTSYGTQKAIGELLVNDYSRHGFVDGRCLRLPIVMTRHDGVDALPMTQRAPTVSGAIASLVGDRLLGHDIVCPLRADTRIAAASAERVIDALLAVHDLPAAAFGHFRAMNLPSLSLTLAELAAASGRAAVK